MMVEQTQIVEPTARFSAGKKIAQTNNDGMSRTPLEAEAACKRMLHAVT